MLFSSGVIVPGFIASPVILADSAGGQCNKVQQAVMLRPVLQKADKNNSIESIEMGNSSRDKPKTGADSSAVRQAVRCC